MAVLGRDALVVKLHAMHRQPGMREPHDQPVVGLRHHREIVRQARALDHQLMIPGRLEGSIDAHEHTGALVLDLR